MIVPLLLFILSFASTYATVAVADLAQYQLLAGLATLASLLLLMRGLLRPAKGATVAARKWIVVDGSNVMHWKDGTPQIETVREVVGHLAALGYTPGVVFDANAGYLMFGKYRHDRAFGKLLGRPEDRVMVVPKGTPADPTVLTAARDLGAQIVTNDRFRDWAEAHPEVREKGHLIRGGYRAGKLWLNLAEPEPAAAGALETA